MTTLRFVICVFSLFSMMAINGAAAEPKKEKYDNKTIIKNIVITVEAEIADGRQLKLQSKPSRDIKSALGSARALLMNSFTIGSNQPEPIPAIFHCGGDITQSDGTCADVKDMCADFGFDFECDKEDDDGNCTNGGC